MSAEHRAKIGDANRGERHGRWKESPSYRGLHNWVGRNFGKPCVCESCGSSDKTRYAWANKDGKYSRNREDWMRLCYQCHYNYDFGERNPNQKVTQDMRDEIKDTTFSYGTTKRLATKYGVHPKTIAKIRYGRNNKRIEETGSV